MFLISSCAVKNSARALVLDNEPHIRDIADSALSINLLYSVPTCTLGMKVTFLMLVS